MVSSETMKSKGLLVAAIALAALWTSSAAAKPQNAAHLCAQAVAGQEVAKRIPRQLLHAISLAESGRWVKAQKANVAWPWTVTAGGKGRYFDSKSAAIRAVRKLQSRGIRNIDVGCMQVNLKYHPKAFKSLHAAFDPATNAAYAAGFLAKLRKDKRSWTQAVKHYHSATRSLHTPYRHKVYKIWRAERRKLRRTQLAQAKSLRKAASAQRTHRRARQLLADNRFSVRTQRWLDRRTRKFRKP